VLATADSQAETTDQLQAALENITQWTRRWRINLNEAKSVHVTYTLRRKDLRRTIQLNGRRKPLAPGLIFGFPPELETPCQTENTTD
jgi:hypothetical protein